MIWKGSTIARAETFILAIGVCYGAPAIGSYFTGLSVSTWYAALAKPPIAPAGWFIGAVWTVLYLLMGIALFLVLDADRSLPAVKKGISFFVLQLGLNVLWSVLFFGLRSPLFALLGIILLWVSIAATLLLFLKVSRPAGFLLLPYILWVSFAAVLNAWILLLNP
ncbi:MAG TPA: TspO/MBR family protein [Methanomicrobiales archaeon]|nr:TspO/MBR family protein [Methanomicrobiales archaeon]